MASFNIRPLPTKVSDCRRALTYTIIPKNDIVGSITRAPAGAKQCPGLMRQSRLKVVDEILGQFPWNKMIRIASTENPEKGWSDEQGGGLIEWNG